MLRLSSCVFVFGFSVFVCRLVLLCCCLVLFCLFLFCLFLFSCFLFLSHVFFFWEMVLPFSPPPTALRGPRPHVVTGPPDPKPCCRVGGGGIQTPRRGCFVPIGPTSRYPDSCPGSGHNQQREEETDASAEGPQSEQFLPVTLQRVTLLRNHSISG